MQRILNSTGGCRNISTGDAGTMDTEQINRDEGKKKKKGMKFYMVVALWEICAGPRLLENLNPDLRS